MDISDREKRLRNRNIMKEEEARIFEKEVLTEEELENLRLFCEQTRANYRQGLEQMAKERAERLKEYMEEPWPPQWKPIKESIQYKCGLISTFVDDPWCIMKIDESDFKSNFKSNPDFADWANDDPHCLKNNKEFVQLVCDSRGYDVDRRHPCPYPFPFARTDVNKLMKNKVYMNKYIDPMLKCVVERINLRAKDHGEEYELFEVKKIVYALRFKKCLITLSVKLVSDREAKTVKDVQAMLHLEGGDSYECVEWRFKPEEPGRSTDPILELGERKGKPPRSTNHSNAANSEPRKKKTKTHEAKTKTGSRSSKARLSPAVKTIVIECCKRYKPFERRADRVKEALERDVAGVNVVVNPEEPRRGCFEIREEGGEVFVSLLDMTNRPFSPLKALDMEKLIARIVKKIR